MPQPLYLLQIYRYWRDIAIYQECHDLWEFVAEKTVPVELMRVSLISFILRNSNPLAIDRMLPP